MTDTIVVSIHKTMLRGGYAAAAPGLVSLVAATTAAQTTLTTYTGMSGMGVAALGVVFFFLAFLLVRNRWWAGIPSLICISWTICFFSVKAARLLMIYYQFNPIQSFADLTAPFSIISLHLCLVTIAGSLAWLMFKALRLSRRLSPQPVNKLVWGALGLWMTIVIWQAATGGALV